MPLHGYSTDRRPPTNLDHLRAHPYSIMIASFQIFAAAAVLGALIFGYRFTSSVLQLPKEPLVGLCAVLIFGGINVVRGLLDDSNDLRRGFRIERGGLILSGAGWTASTVSVFVANHAAIFMWTLGLFISAAIALRLDAGRLEEKRVAREIQDLKL